MRLIRNKEECRTAATALGLYNKNPYSTDNIVASMPNGLPHGCIYRVGSNRNNDFLMWINPIVYSNAKAPCGEKQQGSNSDCLCAKV